MSTPAARSRAAAVLFDMDGVLVDSEPVWTRAEEELAARLGGVWSAEIKAAVVGTRLDVAVPRILGHYGVEASASQVAQTSAWLLARMAELFATTPPLLAGAVELLDAVRERGVATGLVSSSYRVLVDAVLVGVGRHRFDLTIAGDEVAHGKPHPAPYLTACARLGVAPRDCVVVEDSPSGVAAAEAAGAVAVVLAGHAPVAAAVRRPLVATLAGVDVDWLLALPGGGAGASEAGSDAACRAAQAS